MEFANISRSLHHTYQALVPRRPAPVVDLTEDERLDDLDRSNRIRCPQCNWQPDRSSVWYCTECLAPEGLLRGCGTMWNTFETRGRCPGCDHQWRWTSCHACGGWSPHDEWYSDASEE